MKKLTLILLTILALTLTACGASSSTEAVSSTQADPASASLDGATLLLLGTLKLDSTKQAVTPGQAKDLLPLWQVYQEISNSSTSAQAEIVGAGKTDRRKHDQHTDESHPGNEPHSPGFLRLSCRKWGSGWTWDSAHPPPPITTGTSFPVRAWEGAGGVPPDMGGSRPGTWSRTGWRLRGAGAGRCPDTR